VLKGELSLDDFRFLSPTQLVFGRSMHKEAGTLIKQYGTKTLLHYGSGSIKKSGLYDQIVASLHAAGVEFVELAGVQPNPRLSLVHEGIRLCRANGVQAILAVGGGSVIDSAKAIAMGVSYTGDVWDFFCGKAVPAETLPVGVVLTIPAAGSEASKSCVITNEDGWIKRGLNVESNRPAFAIMNPELTFTLPPYQTACGSVDIMAHVMERYFTPTLNVDYTDRLCEATLKTVIYNAPLVMAKPDDYDARAEIMLASTFAHNDLVGIGRLGDWASHHMAHELSGMYDVAHGAALAVIFPAWMQYVYQRHINRFVQFAVRVWDVEPSFFNPELTAVQGIARMREFFRSLGMPTNLRELGVAEARLGELADKTRMPNGDSCGNLVRLTRDDVYNILRAAY